MNTPDSQVIVKRFYQAIEHLIEYKILWGKKTFCVEYSINTWNFNTVQKNPESDMFQIAWLGYLVKDYGISAEWLLTGKGKISNHKPREKRTRPNRKPSSEVQQ